MLNQIPSTEPTPEQIAERNERNLAFWNREVAEAVDTKSRVFARSKLLSELIAQSKWREASNLLLEVDAEISALR